jgi:hypothetical protein
VLKRSCFLKRPVSSIIMIRKMQDFCNSHHQTPNFFYHKRRLFLKITTHLKLNVQYFLVHLNSTQQTLIHSFVAEEPHRDCLCESHFSHCALEPCGHKCSWRNKSSRVRYAAVPHRAARDSQTESVEANCRT